MDSCEAIAAIEAEQPPPPRVRQIVGTVAAAVGRRRRFEFVRSDGRRRQRRRRPSQVENVDYAEIGRVGVDGSDVGVGGLADAYDSNDGGGDVVESDAATDYCSDLVRTRRRQRRRRPLVGMCSSAC